MKRPKTNSPAAQLPRSPRAQVIESLLMQARVLRKGANAHIAEEAARVEQELEARLASIISAESQVAQAA